MFAYIYWWFYVKIKSPNLNNVIKIESKYEKFFNFY
jgi:hypothetical protein